MFPVHTSTSVVRFLQITCQKYYFWKNLHYLRFLTNNLVPSKSAKAKSSPKAFSCIYHKYPRKLYLVDLKMRFKTWKIKWPKAKHATNTLRLEDFSITSFTMFCVLMYIKLSLQFKDTHREKAPSNKTPAFRKSTNMGVWAVGTLNQLFIRDS